MVDTEKEISLNTQEFKINMGPHHPSTHGVFRLLLTMDGETVTHAESIVGYLHRGIEKIAEARTYSQFIPYTDRLDYSASMLMNLGFVQAVERLMEVEVPERAEILRVIICELQRMASHMLAIGTFIQDLGVSGHAAFMYCQRDREKIMVLFEMLCGARQTYNYMRVGGLSYDIPDGFLATLKRYMDEIEASLEDYWALSLENELFIARTKGIAIITKEQAINWALSGPNLRASGVDYDLRKTRPYGVYGRYQFDVPVATEGDVLARYTCRGQEMAQCIRIIRQAMDDLAAGAVMGKVPKVIKPPKGEMYHGIESSRGILSYHIISDGSDKPYRLHIRRPSFINLAILDSLLPGIKLADVVATLGSIDIVLGEVDA